MKDDLEAEGVDIELCLNNGCGAVCLHQMMHLRSKVWTLFMWVHVGPVCLYQARPLDLKTIEYCGSNNRLHKMEFGQDVLKLVMEALSLKKG